MRAAHVPKPWFPRQHGKGNVNSACQIFIQDHGTPECEPVTGFISLCYYLTYAALSFQNEITVRLNERDNSLIGIEIKNCLMIMMTHSTEWIQKYLWDVVCFYTWVYFLWHSISQKSHISGTSACFLPGSNSYL